MCCYGPTHKNPRWRLRPQIVKPSVRNNIFVNVKFQRLFSGAPNPKGVYARHSSIRLDILEKHGYITFEIARRGYNYFRFQSPSWFCQTALPMSFKSGIVQHTSITFCDHEKRVLSLKVNRYLVPIWSYNYASGFGCDHDSTVASWRRHVPYVAVFVFVEFVDI